MAAATAQALATRHLWRTFWGGMALTLPLCAALAVVFAAGSAAHSAWPLLASAAGLTGTVWLFAALPALLFCWLRLKVMRWLFEYYLARPTTQRRAWVMLGTLGTFEALVAVSALFLYLCWHMQLEFWVAWRICIGFSLPWLLAALWASWQVLGRSDHALAQPR